MALPAKKHVRAEKAKEAAQESSSHADADVLKGGAIIQVKGLRKNFGKKEILRNISLEIRKGEIFGIIGMSGSGKTVLLKTLIHFYHPDNGSIQYAGANPKHLSFRKFFGFSTQESCFYPELSIRENLSHFGKLYGMSKQALNAKIAELSDMLELRDALDKKSSELSGGMQKRLDIACALIHNPQLLILDEPTLELDPILRREIMSLIHKINQTGVTVIMASHLLGGIEVLSNNVAIMHNGEILTIDSPVKLRESYGKREEVYLKSYPGNYRKIADALSKDRQKLTIDFIDHKGHAIIINCRDAEKVLNHLLPLMKSVKEDIIDIHASKPSLTEIFTKLVEEKRRESNAVPAGPVPKR